MEFPTSSQPIDSPLQYDSDSDSSPPSSSPDSPWQPKFLRRFTSRGATKGRSNGSNSPSRIDSGCSDSRIRRYSMGNVSTSSAQNPKEGKGPKRARAKTAVGQCAGASPRTPTGFQSTCVSKNASVTFDAQTKIAVSTASFASSPSLEQQASGTSERTITAANISNQGRALSPAPVVGHHSSNLDSDAIAGILSTPAPYPMAARNTSGFSQPIRYSEPHVTPNNSPSVRGAEMGAMERTRSSTVGNDSRPYTSIGRNGSLRAKQGRAGSPLINSYTGDPSAPVPEALVSPKTPTFHDPFENVNEPLPPPPAPQGDQAQEQARHIRSSAAGKVRGVGGSPVHGLKKGQGIGMQTSRSIEVAPVFMPSPKQGQASKSSISNSSNRRGSFACPPPAHIASTKSSPQLAGKGLGIGYVGTTDINTVSCHASNTVQVDVVYETAHPKEETLAQGISTVASESGKIDGPALPTQIKYVGETLGQSAAKTEILMMNTHMQELEQIKRRALEEEQNAHAAYDNAYFDLLAAQAHFMEAQASLNIAKAKLDTSSMIVDVCIDNAVNAVGAVGRWKSKIDASEKLRH
ncbi:hypothetical protein AB1N83_010805 [Pleurotus pulmonarius]